MKILPTAIAAAIVGLAAQTAVLAADGSSLAEVAAIIADAVAADDAVMLQRHTMTYQDAVAVSVTKKRNESDYLMAVKERKKRVDRAWREIREANLIVDHVKIEDVEIRKNENVKPEQYLVVAIVFPVFNFEGENTPAPMLALYFAQVNGQWKYWY